MSLTRPEGSYEKEGRVYNRQNELIEVYENRWLVVKDGGRSGWWRFHEHYDRDGYCDNPARGY